MSTLWAVFSSQPNSVTTAEKSVKSILNQTLVPDRIIWFLPERSIRFNMDYPDVPQWATTLAKENTRFEIVRCADFGPATKFAPLLDMPDVKREDMVILFDDDTEYQPDAVQLLYEATQGRSNTAAGYFSELYMYKPFRYSAYFMKPGKTQIEWQNRVIVLLTSGLVIYPRYALPESAKTVQDYYTQFPHTFLNDDLILAHFAYENGVHLYHVSHPTGSAIVNAFYAKGHLSYTNSTTKATMLLMTSQQLPIPLAELIIVIVFSILLLFLVVYIIYRTRKSKPGKSTMNSFNSFLLVSK
jgi:hypothetical protein